MIGQELRLPIVVSDADQDALSYLAQGLPVGARIERDPQYGKAWLIWTPSVDQLGSYDVSLQITDSGLPPVNAGVDLPANFVAQPNTVVADIRLVVREANNGPAVLTVQAIQVEVLCGGNASTHHYQ